MDVVGEAQDIDLVIFASWNSKEWFIGEVEEFADHDAGVTIRSCF